MNNPTLVGRACDESPESASERSATVKRVEIEIPYTSGAVGAVRVELFTSDDDEDRGGYIIRLTINDGGSSLVPTGVNGPNGLDLHLPGEAEGLAALSALAGLLAAHSHSSAASV